MGIVSRSTEETKHIGKEFAVRLKPGDLVLIRGDLGAGKTTFVQGVVQGLGGVQRASSPSFTIVQEYELPEGLFRHVDLYRLDDPSLDINTLGFPEMLADERAITAVEWSERLDKIWERPGRIINVSLAHGSRVEERTITIDIGD